MNAIDQSSNRIPCHTDWHRYDSPTVLRRHGRGFLERSWKARDRRQITQSRYPKPSCTAWLKAMAATICSRLITCC
jgi:hypothetical protein